MLLARCDLSLHDPGEVWAVLAGYGSAGALWQWPMPKSAPDEPAVECSASAESSDLLGHHKMGFAWASIIRTHTSFQFVGAQDAVSFGDVALAVNPPRLNRVQPGTFGGKETRQDAHAFPGLFDRLIMFAKPGVNGLTLVPGGIVPDQHQSGLSFF